MLQLRWNEHPSAQTYAVQVENTEENRAALASLCDRLDRDGIEVELAQYGVGFSRDVYDLTVTPHRWRLTSEAPCA